MFMCSLTYAHSHVIYVGSCVRFPDLSKNQHALGLVGSIEYSDNLLICYLNQWMYEVEKKPNPSDSHDRERYEKCIKFYFKNIHSCP